MRTENVKNVESITSISKLFVCNIFQVSNSISEYNIVVLELFG